MKGRRHNSNHMDERPFQKKVVASVNVQNLKLHVDFCRNHLNDQIYCPSVSLCTQSSDLILTWFCWIFPKSNFNCLKVDNGNMLRLDPSSYKTQFIILSWHAMVTCKALLWILPSKGSSSLQKLILCPRMTWLIIVATFSLLVPTSTYVSSKAFIRACLWRW